MSDNANFKLSVWQVPTDLVQLRAEVKAGWYVVFIKRGKVYIKDPENGECIMIGDVKEAEERGKYE